MLIKQAPDLRESDVTPHELYLRRRDFIKAAGTAAVAAGIAQRQGSAPSVTSKHVGIRSASSSGSSSGIRPRSIPGAVRNASGTAHSLLTRASARRAPRARFASGSIRPRSAQSSSTVGAPVRTSSA